MLIIGINISKIITALSWRFSDTFRIYTNMVAARHVATRHLK